MWSDLSVIISPTSFDCIWKGDNVIKYSIILYFFITLAIFFFIVQKIMFARWFDIKTNHWWFTNDLFLKLLPLIASTSTMLTFLSLSNSNSVYLTLPTDYSAIIGHKTPLMFLLDVNSLGFISATAFIGTAVNTFVPHYMKGEVCVKRFWNLLNAFLFSMILLLCSGNYITLLFFWECIGFFSYFLINFWKKKASTLKSAMKAFIYNSVSDVCLIVFIVLYFKNYGTFNFPNETVISLNLNNISKNQISLTSVTLLIAASCKSAQFFFHFWLPDSMDAPAPASALIHSATLVAAGVFLIIRSKSLLHHTENVTTFFVITALLTIFVGGLSASNQTDLKKILAYSTISNCGFMVYFSLCNSDLNSFIFFYTHGVLKAMSFLIVGFLIISTAHKQDYRYTGNLNMSDSFVTTALVITVGSLGGLPLSIMHQIKHFVIKTSYTPNLPTALINIGLLIGILTSVVYSTKVLTLVLTSNRYKTKVTHKDIEDDEFWIKLSTIASITRMSYLLIFIYTMVINNNIIDTGASIYLIADEMDCEEVFFKFLINEPSNNYQFGSDKLQLCLTLCYLITIVTISLPTWASSMQKSTLYFLKTIPLVLITSALV